MKKKKSIIMLSLLGILIVGGITLNQLGIHPIQDALFSRKNSMSGHTEGCVFASYAGPVFPLSFLEKEDDITVQRNIAFDFSPYIPTQETYEYDGETYSYDQYDTATLVTDGYTLTNTGEKEITLQAIYPFAGKLQSEKETIPTLLVNGKSVDTTVWVGPYAGDVMTEYDDGEQPLYQGSLNSWKDYKTMLSSGEYMKKAMDQYPELTQVVTVYELTTKVDRKEMKNSAIIEIEFPMDREKTTCLTYGFNGYKGNNENGGEISYSYHVPQEDEVDDTWSRYLMVIGDDIKEYNIKAYEIGENNTEIVLDGVTAEVRRYETTLGDMITTLIKEYQKRYDGDRNERQNHILQTLSEEQFHGIITKTLYEFGVLSENTNHGYDAGILEDLFMEVESIDRVLYLKAPITIQAGETLTIKATMKKERSFNYTCKNEEETRIDGYDMVTKLGSNLNFLTQTASIEDRGVVKIIRQNFGFDLEKNIRKVPLDLTIEEYYLEVKPVK